MIYDIKSQIWPTMYITLNLNDTFTFKLHLNDNMHCVFGRLDQKGKFENFKLKFYYHGLANNSSMSNMKLTSKNITI